MTKTAKTRRRAALAIDLQTKTQPTQDRSRQTYEAILDAAAQLLEEVGVERFSTNMVCARASLTPPALYRYFPNKYALLKELGTRLMQAQDQVVYAWLDAGGLVDAGIGPFEATQDILGRVIDITRRQPAALWILRAMRAVPAMREVRIASRTDVAERLYQALSRAYPLAVESELRRAVRLNVELSLAVVEMVLEEPDIDAAETEAEFNRMVAGLYQRFA